MDPAGCIVWGRGCEIDSLLTWDRRSKLSMRLFPPIAFRCQHVTSQLPPDLPDRLCSNGGTVANGLTIIG